MQDRTNFHFESACDTDKSIVCLIPFDTQDSERLRGKITREELILSYIMYLKRCRQDTMHSFMPVEYEESFAKNGISHGDVVAAWSFVIREFETKVSTFTLLQSVRERYAYISELCKKREGTEAYKFRMLKQFLKMYGKSYKNVIIDG